jgi:hypothetical protein
VVVDRADIEQKETALDDIDSTEAGMTTAELLGNAALGIAALVAIWAVLQALGLNIVSWIGGQLGV